MDHDPELEPDPLSEPDPVADETIPEPELETVASMSLWTLTPSAKSALVPGMWMDMVRAGASMRSAQSTSSSFMCSSITNSPC